MSWLIKTVIQGLVLCVALAAAICLGLWLWHSRAATNPAARQALVQRAADGGAQLAERAAEAVSEQARKLAERPAPQEQEPSLQEREAKWQRAWEEELARMQQLHKNLIRGEESTTARR